MIPIPMLVVVAVVVVNLLTASSVRATAGPKGVIVNFGVFGWPRFRYPLGRIQHAEAITIPPHGAVGGVQRGGTK